jgi:response regulator RpfG family c-di-GMP phosphodiesterase
MQVQMFQSTVDTPRPFATPLLTASPVPHPTAASLLIVDDEAHVREVLKATFTGSGYQVEEVDNGADAVAVVTARPYDVMLLDMDLPQLSGDEVLRRVRKGSASPHLKVIVLSGQGDGDHLAGTLFAGADDFLPKPFSVAQLRARVTAAVRLKQAQDRADQLHRRAATANAEMEKALRATGDELLDARGALVLALAKLVEARSNETGPHLIRLQKYSRILTATAAEMPVFLDRLTPEVRRTIEQAAPLHDIGKVAVPDAVLNKPGKLTPDEFAEMKKHSAAGADTLAQVRVSSQFASTFLYTAEEIARHHHEKWNGTGYPDGLSGQAIPLSARVVAVADVYDALRSPRVYKKGYTHDEAVEVILTGSPGHFDPALLAAFALVHPEFATVYDETVA